MKVIAITPDRKSDTLAALVVEGLYANDIEVIGTSEGNGVRKRYTDEEVVEHSKDADYVFVIWGKPVSWNAPLKYHLLRRIGRPDITAYIDGSEWSANGYMDSEYQDEEALIDCSRLRGRPWINQEMFGYCRWYFKRVCFLEDIDMGLIPCYIGALNSYFRDWDEDKEFNTFLPCPNTEKGFTDPEQPLPSRTSATLVGVRQSVYKYCKQLKQSGVDILIDKTFKFDAYLKVLARSYIGISSWGAGNCCRTMFEMTANKVCCFVQRPIIVYPDKFVDGVSCVEYSTIEEFKYKLGYYRKNLDKCVEIGRNGYAHVRRYHTSKQRVQDMISTMKSS